MATVFVISFSSRVFSWPNRRWRWTDVATLHNYKRARGWPRGSELRPIISVYICARVTARTYLKGADIASNWKDDTTYSVLLILLCLSRGSLKTNDKISIKVKKGIGAAVALELTRSQADLAKRSRTGWYNSFTLCLEEESRRPCINSTEICQPII